MSQLFRHETFWEINILSVRGLFEDSVSTEKFRKIECDKRWTRNDWGGSSSGILQRTAISFAGRTDKIHDKTF
jgi:hypothetical protein